MPISSRRSDRFDKSKQIVEIPIGHGAGSVISASNPVKLRARLAIIAIRLRYSWKELVNARGQKTAEFWSSTTSRLSPTRWPRFSISTATTLQRFTPGTAAVESARSLQPDLIISDVIMPDMDGIEAAINIRGFSAELQDPAFFRTSRHRRLAGKCACPWTRVRNPRQAGPSFGSAGKVEGIDQLRPPI